MTLAQEGLALQLFDIGAIKFGAFRLKMHEANPDAPLSPIYLNLRTAGNPKPGPLTPEIMGIIGAELVELAAARDIKYDHVAGIPNAGDPFVDAFAAAAGASRPASVVRMEKVEADGVRRIAGVTGGNYQRGESLLLLDDLITRADSKVEAIKAAEDAGLRVSDLMVLVDRQQGGVQQLADAGYRVHTVYTLAELLAVYADHGKITAQKSAEVTDWIRSNG